jgi:P27 family predicted phage terminase small subunit
MVRGRKPKRQELATRDGSWNTHPEREKEVVPTTCERPSPPLLVQADELTLALWDETCDILQSMRLLVAEDKPLIEAYVLNYALFLRCVQDIQKNGDTYVADNGNLKASGSATNYARYIQAHQKLLSELGLTPSSRARLASPVDRSASESNPVGDLLKKLGGQ